MVKEIKEKEDSRQGGLNYADRPNNVSAYNQPTNNSIMAGVIYPKLDRLPNRHNGHYD